MKFISYTKNATNYEFVGENGEKIVIPLVDIILVDDNSGAVSVKLVGTRQTIGYYLK